MCRPVRRCWPSNPLPAGVPFEINHITEYLSVPSRAARFRADLPILPTGVCDPVVAWGLLTHEEAEVHGDFFAGLPAPRFLVGLQAWKPEKTGPTLSDAECCMINVLIERILHRPRKPPKRAQHVIRTGPLHLTIKR